MGRCSFRACVDAEPLILGQPASAVFGQTEDTSSIQQQLPVADDRSARERVTCQLRGAGVLAMRGHFGAHFVTGALSCRVDGCMVFSWTADLHDDSVLMRPRLALDGEFLGKRTSEGLMVLSLNDPDVLRERAQLVSRRSQAFSWMQRGWFAAIADGASVPLAPSEEESDEEEDD